MFDLICFGTVVVDLYFRTDDINPPEGIFNLSSELRKDAASFHKGLGGGAINVAIGAKKNGLKVGLACVIGNNSFKNSVIRRLKDLRLDYSLSEFQDHYNNVSLILATAAGERSLINYRSPMESQYEDPRELKKLFHAKLFYMANLPNFDIQKRVVILKAIQKQNIVTVTTLGSQDCHRPLAELKDYISVSDIFILNKLEFSEIVKKPMKEIDLAQNVQELYLSGIHHGILVVTDGENGSFAYSQGTIYHQERVNPSKMIDVNGAGDAYTSGFLAAFLQDKDIPRAMKTGALYASTVISRLGAN